MFTVVYDHQIFCRQRYGGVSRYFYEIAQCLARMDGVDVKIVAPLCCNRYFRRTDAARPAGVSFPCLKRGGRIVEYVSWAIARSVFRRYVAGDVCHETYYARRGVCARSVKRVITIHDMIPERLYRDSAAHQRTRRIKAEAVRRADHIICVSESTRRELLALLGVPVEKITVIHHGCLQVSPPPRPAGAEDGVRPYILYVGLRGGYKNFARLVAAYASAPVLREGYKIVCFGGGAFTADEKTMLSAAAIGPDQVAHVQGGDAQLAKLYASAALLAYPSLCEGFGMPPLEAMAFGCPVACSNTSSLPEVVGPAAEMFDPEDVRDIARALTAIASSKSRRLELIELGRKRSGQFSWERCAGETLAVYKKVLREGLRAPVGRGRAETACL